MKSLIFLVCILCIGVQSYSQLNQIGQDIDGIAGDQTGHSVDLNGNGNVVVIGGPFNEDIGSRNGVTRVYEFNGTSWIQKGQDIYGIPTERFGHSVAINDNGDRIFVSSIVVGSTQDGSVYCYEFNGTSWVQLGQTISSEHPGASDIFGYSLATNASGNRVVAGAIWDTDGGGVFSNTSGSARAFEFDGTVWVQMGQDLDGEYNITGEQFGTSVTMDDSGLFIGVGGTYGNTGDPNPGVVRVYAYNSISSSWVQRGPDITGDQPSEGFGSSVSIGLDGGIIAVSSLYKSPKGGVKVFVYGSEGWSQYGQTITGANVGDALGGARESLAMDKFGNKLIVASELIDANGENSGQAQIYSFNHTNHEWQQIGIINGENEGDKMNQLSMSDDGQRVALGAIRNSGGGKASGHVRIYGLGTLDNENYSLSQAQVYPNPNNGTFRVVSDNKISSVEAFDMLGRKIDFVYNEFNGQVRIKKGEGIFNLKVSFNNGLFRVIKIEVL